MRGAAERPLVWDDPLLVESGSTVREMLQSSSSKLWQSSHRTLADS